MSNGWYSAIVKKTSEKFHIRKNTCIICLKPNKLTSTENDREAIIAAAAVRKQVIFLKTNLVSPITVKWMLQNIHHEEDIRPN